MSRYSVTNTIPHDTNGRCKTQVMEASLSYVNQGACGGRTRVEKLLLFLVFAFALTIVGLVVALVMANKDDGVDKAKEAQAAAPEICNTEECVKAAARVLEDIDVTVDPCEDFYHFACGAWKRKHVIPEDRSRQTVFGLLSDGVQIINKYLLEDDQSYRDVEAIQKAKDLYASCTNLEKIEDLTMAVAIPLMEELEGWPVLGSNPGGNWDQSTFDLVGLLVTLRKYNNRPIINLYVSPDIKDSTNHIIYIDQPGFGLPGRDYYLEPHLQHMREAYVTFAKSMAELFGADPTTAETDMREMMNLEIELANISMKAEDRRDNEVLYNKLTVDQMAQNFTEPSSTELIQFDWLNYVQSIMSMEGVNIPINGTEPVVVRAVPYFNKLFNVLRKYSPRTVANYAVWYIMKSRASNLPQKFGDLVKDYNKAVYGTATSRARWRTCVSFAVGNMGLAIGHMFVKETFDESAKTVALEMIQTIRVAFNELLDELDWMDGKTKALARDKAAAMQEWIGYPEYVMREEEINKLYENVTATRDMFFENVLSYLKWRAVDGLNDLREKYNKSIWTTAPSTVNAFYNAIRNNIMFPAGILQPPFYSKGQPKSLNYGGIGVVIGHEITHGFDDRGRQYDKEGNLVEWWDDNIINNFKEKAQCIVDQYGGFVVPEANLSVNGINTQGENIADNGGLKQSFRAYRKWVEAQGKEEPLLPGVDFTHNQLFFINFAQIWCNNLRPEYAIKAVNTGVHSPMQFRVIGTLQNSPEFSRAFNCPSSSYMNRQNKCYVW